MADEHDSWLNSALGIDIGGLKDKAQAWVEDKENQAKQWVGQKVDEAKQGLSDAEDWANKQVEDGKRYIEQKEDDAKKWINEKKDDVKKAVGSAKQAVTGDESGKPVPRPMELDCKPEHGKVPGPKNHLYCGTHGHVLDVDAKTIIAASVASYVKDGIARAVGSIDPSALTADIGRSGPLNSPSYVNNPNPSPNLIGGDTASAGDSYFVTGGQKGQLVQRAKDLKGAATALYDLGKKLQEKGIGGTFEFKDDKLIESAKNVTGVADGIMKLANAIDGWTGSGNKESIEKGSKAVDYVSKIIDAADAVLAVKKLSVSAEEMANKPNQASVEAWADDVGNAFDKAGGLIGLIPSDGLPGFITSYYKGLLSAPKNYITAFKTIMHARYDKIDMEAGITKSNQAARNWGTNKVEWEGDLVPLYIKAYFQPKAKDGKTLQDFMHEHQKMGGVDLYKVNLVTGKALLGAAIAREMPDEDDPNAPSAKVAWMDYVQSF